MAAILDALAPYVKKLVADMADEEVRMLLGVSGDIKKLEDNVECLEAFLVDAERRRITDKIVQRWVRKLKDALYDATDILDLCRLEADKLGDNIKEKAPTGCIQSFLLCLRNPVFAHKIGRHIKELNQRLEGIHKEADKFKFNIGLGSNMEPRTPSFVERSSQKMTSEFDESAIVGEKIENETRELSQLLISSSVHEIKVMSIVGTGGMGKTTLAQKIFNIKTVQEHFKLKIWLSITQHFDEAELLRTAIDHAGGHHDGEQDKTLLTRILIDTLSTDRFLLVLDDVWSDEAWSNVLCVPIKNSSHSSEKLPVGNWVIITTRSEDIAQRMGASFYQHRVSPLDEDDAWSLLNKQLPPSPSQVSGTDHLRDIGMKIINKCGGLPLAIKVMGGLLATKSRSEREWEAILKHRAWSIAGLPEQLDKRIYLSYDDLSPHLKQCFLYCSLFPKGTSIPQIIVVPMWISEGFIQPQDGSRSSHDDQLEEIATNYYQELITRNLIEPTKESSITGYECTMHDVLRSFAEFMAREDSIMVQDNQVVCGSIDSLVRRISIGPSKFAPEWAPLQKQGSLRTLIINCKISFQPIHSLSSFSRLRVLSITGGDCDRLVGSLCELRHLRYICLEGTDISRLPDNIHRLKFLQHIVLTGSRNLESLPSTITELEHLRTLDIYGSNVNVVIPKRFGGLTNIRSLFGFPVHMGIDQGGGWCSLEEIGPLCQLRKLTLHGLENVAASWLARVETGMISRKEHLDYLELNWSSYGCMGSMNEIEEQQEQQAVEAVIQKLCPPSSIQHLIIQRYFGRELPIWMKVPATRAFKSLRILKLKHLTYCTQLPDGLCLIPSLEELQIKKAYAIKSVGPEFQSPVSIGGSGGVSGRSVVAFPNLTNLYLEGMYEWEEWNWEEQRNDGIADSIAMPALKVLTIGSCRLSCLPQGLASSKRHALRELYLDDLINLEAVENFPSIVELKVVDCPLLKRISGLSRLQKIGIFHCSNVEVLEGVPSLDSMEMKDDTMKTIPEYLTAVNPRYLKLHCSNKLYKSLLLPGKVSTESYKIRHIKSLTISRTPSISRTKPISRFVEQDECSSRIPRFGEWEDISSPSTTGSGSSQLR